MSNELIQPIPFSSNRGEGHTSEEEKRPERTSGRERSQKERGWRREEKTGMETNFFHTQLWFPASDHDFRRFESDFQCFCEVITGKKHWGRNRIDHGCLCGTEFTLMSLYSTEITRYTSWFLEYKLTLFPHGRSWWILYTLKSLLRGLAFTKSPN